MSRIILSRWDDGIARIVIGWDHPAGGAYWQEFNREPDPDPQSGAVDWSKHEDWQEMLRFDGYMPGIPLEEFYDSVPDDIKPLITPEVMAILESHKRDPDSGYNTQPIDLTEQARNDDIRAGIEAGNMADDL